MSFIFFHAHTLKPAYRTFLNLSVIIVYAIKVATFINVKTDNSCKHLTSKHAYYFQKFLYAFNVLWKVFGNTLYGIKLVAL